MPGRHANTSDYRYGFQGQEMDDELKGEGNSVNYKFRMHDPRVGRFFATDPLKARYPWNSPYVFSENMLMQYVELEGLEIHMPYIYAKSGVYGETTQKVITAVEDGTESFFVGTWSFVTKDAWSSETWKGVWSFYTEVADAASYGTSTRRPPTTPALDAMAQDFNDKVIDGDTYSRTRYGTEFLLGIIGAKGTDKVVKISNVSNLVNRFSSNVNMYRVQGGVGANSSKIRFTIKDGDISIQGNEMLYVTFDDKNRALQFLAKRGDDAYLVEVKVNKDIVDKIKKDAVKQSEAAHNPGRPQKVDPTKTDGSYGIPKEYFDDLLEAIKDVKTTTNNGG